MPGTFFGPFSEQYRDYAFENNANLGRFPLGHTLELPDGRQYKFALNDGTVEVAGDLYQALAAVTDHSQTVVSTTPAVDDITIASTLGGTLAAVDIYAEGTAHTNKEAGLGYAFRITRAFTAGLAHAAVTASSIITVNLAAAEQIQVAGNVSTEITYVRNRYHQVAIHDSPPTGDVAGVSPGVAAADRFYWSQVHGPAPVLVDGTLLIGLPVMASITTNGAVENFKRRMRTGGATIAGTAAASAQLALMDQDGNTVGYFIGVTSTTTSVAAIDVSGPISIHSPIVGICMRVNVTAEIALIDLKID